MGELRRIMCVEDEGDIRTIVKLALETVGGYEVLLCASGQEAIEKGPRFLPEFILLDAMMPGIDGPATLIAMRGMPALANIPVVFMTAKVQPAEIAAFKAIGAVDVIAKPFDPQKLAAIVKSIWERNANQEA